MHQCLANITMPINGEDVTVTLDVDFEIEPADPSVGIMGDGIGDFTAKVIEADLDGVTDAELAAMQTYFDANTHKYIDSINEDCIASLDKFADDDREAIAEGDYHYYRGSAS